MNIRILPNKRFIDDTGFYLWGRVDRTGTISLWLEGTPDEQLECDEGIRNIVNLLTHETIHLVLNKLESYEVSFLLDSICPSEYIEGYDQWKT